MFISGSFNLVAPSYGRQWGRENLKLFFKLS